MKRILWILRVMYGMVLTFVVIISPCTSASAYTNGQRVMASLQLPAYFDGTNVHSDLLNPTWVFQQSKGVHGTIIGDCINTTAFGYSDYWCEVDWDSGPPAHCVVDPQNPNADCIGWSAEIELQPAEGDVIQPSYGIAQLETNNYTSGNLYFQNGNAPYEICVPHTSHCGGLATAFGNCTWYAYGRMLELNYSANTLSIFSDHAYNWANDALTHKAKTAGFKVDSTPAVGAIAQLTTIGNSSATGTYGSDGHVAIVEWVSNDGSTITVSESSYDPGETTSAADYLWNLRTCPRIWFSNFIHIPFSTTQFSTGITAGAGPVNITTGPDGNLWFVEHYSDRIGRITKTGVVTEFSTGITPVGGPESITAGPDGNLWFTENGKNQIGRITTTGRVTNFSTGITAGANLEIITAGPDGNLWFTEPSINRIGRITTTGRVTEFSTGITPGAEPWGITTGPDGNLWFTEYAGNRIGRITTTGRVTEFSTGITPGANPESITTGPDGNLWFTEPSINRIGRITRTGRVTEFSAGITTVTTADGLRAGLEGITAGPDGNLWFTEYYDLQIGRITTTGVVTEFSTGITTMYMGPGGITTGPDGNLWFTEANLNAIGRMVP